MEKSKKRNKIIILIAFLVVVLAVVAGVVLWLVRHTHADKSLQNIYFTEYENEKDKNDTIIFKYDPISDKVVKIGKVPGYLMGCVIDKEETCITGFLCESPVNGINDIVQYDIRTGTIESKNVAEEIDKLTVDDSWGAWLYDGGNKMLIDYADEEGDVRLLSYDIMTGGHESIPIDVGEISYYLAINEQGLWYRRDSSVYQYDWTTQTETKISDSAYSGPLEPDMGLIAYTKDIHCEEIYLYDINQGINVCIASRHWNTYYGSLDFTNAMWTNGGRHFCYVKYFPGLFQEADASMMVYDVENGRSHRIYKVKATLHELKYISSN